MKYVIRPLQTFEEYLLYFQKRCNFNKKFHPHFTDYFQSQYEVDYYDLFSRHYGLFHRKQNKDCPIGFVRITKNTNLTNDWYYELPEKIKEFILDSLNQSKQKEKEPELPFLKQFDRRFRNLHQYLKNKTFTAELGRLIVFDPNTNFKTLLNFISYTLAMGQYSGLDYYLFKSKCRHAKIYNLYFGADYMNVNERSEGLTPCAYDLVNLSKKAQTNIHLVYRQFTEAQGIIPIEFINHKVNTITQPIVEYDFS